MSELDISKDKRTSQMILDILNILVRESVKSFPLRYLLIGEMLRKVFMLFPKPILVYNNTQKAFHPLSNFRVQIGSVIERELQRHECEYRKGEKNPMKLYSFFIEVMPVHTIAVIPFTGVNNSYSRFIITKDGYFINETFTLAGLLNEIDSTNSEAGDCPLLHHYRLVKSIMERLYEPADPSCEKDDIPISNMIISHTIESFNLKQVLWKDCQYWSNRNIEEYCLKNRAGM